MNSRLFSLFLAEMYFIGLTPGAKRKVLFRDQNLCKKGNLREKKAHTFYIWGHLHGCCVSYKKCLGSKAVVLNLFEFAAH